MADVCDGYVGNLENLKNSVRKSFARLYAAVKARELRTLRQLEVIGKQCQNDEDFERNCVQNIHISYDIESTLLDNVNNFGVIDLERLSFDNNLFSMEDYVSPNNDHMYLYKCIEQVTENESGLQEIEEAALKQITSTTDCVCYVSIRTEEVSKQFQDLKKVSAVECSCDSNVSACDGSDTKSSNGGQPEKKSVEINDMTEIKKINPTDDWLNLIKTQTETEPVQLSDVMEHSTITCT